MFIIVGGVVEFDFSRLLEIADELCEEGVLDPKNTKAQIGHCRYVPKHYDSYRFADGEQFHSDIENADIIITHGGIGTLVYALKAGKKVIVFPRLKEFHEHLDDHQMEICRAFRDAGYVQMATSKEELAECIAHTKEFIPKIFLADNTKMIKILTNYIDGTSNHKNKESNNNDRSDDHYSCI